MSTVYPGIYAIIHKESGKLYIGSSNRIKDRWSEHRVMLRENRHHSILLQRAWNKYGEEAFEFKILEVGIAKEDLKDKEQHWMDFYRSYDPQFGYNICHDAYRRKDIIPWMKGKHHKPESLAKLRRAKLGKKLSEEHKRHISESQVGKTLSKEHVESISSHKQAYWDKVHAGEIIPAAHYKQEYWEALDPNSKTMKQLIVMTDLTKETIIRWLKKFGFSYVRLDTRFKPGHICTRRN